MPTPPKDKRSEKKKDETPLPPQPIPVVVQVVNGSTVQIPLRIYGKQEQETGYIIRKGPALGKIVSLQPIESEVWVLTYQHTAALNGEAGQQDRILFAAQNKKGVSAAVEIVLNIVDNAPELSLPGATDFGKIPVGFPASRVVTVSNNGGGLLEGTVAVDPPWSIEPAGYSLRRGEKALFRVTLVPDGAREYDGRLHFLGATNEETPLHATAYTPLVIEPAATLELTGDSARSGDLTLSNRTDKELTVRLEADPRLHLPPQVVLPPKKTQTVSAMLGADDPWGIDAVIRISLGNLSWKVRVQGTPTAPQLQVEQTALEFEKVESGTNKSLSLNLANGGGSRASVNVQIPAPFRASAKSLTVGPGKTEELVITLDAAAPGPVADKLILTESGSTVEIALRAEVMPRKQAPHPRLSVSGTSIPAGSSAVAESKMESKPEVVTSVLSALIANATGGAQNVTGITGIEIVRTTPGTAEIAWNPPKASGELNYRIDVRRLSLDAEGKLLQNWIPIPDVQFTKKPARVTALITGIPPGINVTARLVALTAQNEPCAISIPVHFYVPVPMAFLTRRNILLASLVVLVGAAVVLRWRRKMREKAEE